MVGQEMGLARLVCFVVTAIGVVHVAERSR